MFHFATRLGSSDLCFAHCRELGIVVNKKNPSMGRHDKDSQNSVDGSGQVIATSHDLTPNGGLLRGNLLFQGNLGC